MAAPQRRKAAAGKAAAVKALPRRRVAAHESDPKDGSDEGGSSSSSSSKSSSSSSSSSKSSTGKSSGSSRSRVSSGGGVIADPGAGSDEEDQPEPGAEEDQPEPAVEGQPAPKARGGAASARHDDRLVFGCCWITPRRAADFEITGYQASCTNPDHQRDGRCTREYGVGKAGSDDIALRRMKAWLVLYGASTASPDRAAHRAALKKIEKLADGKDLPSEADLDALAPVEWSMDASGGGRGGGGGVDAGGSGDKKRRRHGRS